MDIIENPLHQVVVHAQRRYQFIHSHVFHLIVVELDFQVGGEIEFACQVAQHALEERVDGLHPEVAVVMQQQVESRGSTASYLLGVKGKRPAHCGEIVVGVGQLVGDAIQLT